MYKVVPFKEKHLTKIIPEDIKSYWFDTGLAKEKEKSGICVTILHNHDALACAGIDYVWEGRGHIWSIFSPESKHHFVAVFRAARKWLAFEIQNNYRRIELSADLDVPISGRRAEALGFVLEAPILRCYLPDGKDSSLYALVRNE